MNLWQYNTFWITGASDGIGKSLVLSLAVLGKNLILSSRNIEKLKVIKQECFCLSDKYTNKEATIVIKPLDCSNIALCKTIAHNIANEVDVVVFSAGISQRALAFEMEEKSNAYIFTVNFVAPVEISSELLKVWKETQQHTKKQNIYPKKIVIISSVAGYLPVPLRAMYGASKCALAHYFETIHNELQKQGVQKIGIVNIIPGFVNTNISQKAITGNFREWGKMDINQAKGIKTSIVATQILKTINSRTLYKKKHIGLTMHLHIILYLHKNFSKLANYVLSHANTTK